MQNLLSEYLLQYKQCPLPQIGTLIMQQESALVNIADKKILPVNYKILLSPTTSPNNSLINFIAKHSNISFDEANYKLHQYIEELKKMSEKDSHNLSDIGKFYVAESGNIEFEQGELPDYFYPTIVAEKVIHPNSSYQLLVGEQETNTAEMSSYYNIEVVKMRKTWIIWAIIFIVISMLIILLYLNNHGSNAFWGNASEL